MRIRRIGDADNRPQWVCDGHRREGLVRDLLMLGMAELLTEDEVTVAAIMEG